MYDVDGKGCFSWEPIPNPAEETLFVGGDLWRNPHRAHFDVVGLGYGNTVGKSNVLRDAGEILYLDDPGRLKLGLGGKAGFALFAFGAIEDSGNLDLVLHADVQGKALAGADEVDGGGSEEVGSEVERDLAGSRAWPLWLFSSKTRAALRDASGAATMRSVLDRLGSPMGMRTGWPSVGTA